MAYTRSKAQAGRGTIFAIGPVSGTVAPTGLTGSTTSTSPTITMASTTGVTVGLGVSGTGIPTGATVVSISAGVSITISAPATATSGSPEALTFAVIYTTVGELKVGNPGDGKYDTEDVSNFQSNIDKEFKKMMRNNGTPKLTGNRVSSDAGQQAIDAAYDDADNSYMFQITIPKRSDQLTTGDTYTFDALVIGRTFGPVETNKTIPFDVDLQITGPVTKVLGS